MNLEIGSSHEVIKKLVDAKTDIGFTVTIDFPEFKSIIEKMSVIDLAQIELVFIAPKNSKFLDRKLISPKELVGMPYISRYGSSGIQSQVEKILANTGITENDLNVIFRLENSSSEINAVSEGLGVSIVAMLQAEKHV